MKVSELGEFELIDLLAKTINRTRNKQATSWKQLLIGVGDDAAAWRSDVSIQLATVDSLVQDIHFSLDLTSWEDLGWKAMAINLSDIAAMGALPKYALISLILPGSTEVEDVTALYRGLIKLARQSGVAIIGGDTDAATLVTITVTILGSAMHNKHILTRSAAQPGDQIAVTGYLGAAAAALEMFTKQLSFDSKTSRYLAKALHHPQPRITEGQLLVNQGVKAAIDISDGLIADLKHICKNSRVGARIEVDHIPILPAVKANFVEESLELALSGGEDYELLFTGSAKVIDRVKQEMACPVTVVGEIVADEVGEVALVDSRGNLVKPGKTGWEHFTTR